MMRKERRKPTWTTVVQWLWLLVVTGFLVVVATNANTEERERTNQNCLIFEGQHKADVQRLANTYSYLQHVERSHAKDPITVLVRRNLPQLEREAGIDPAPDYCDEPGFGLPEPDPVVPKRPKGI